VLWLVLRACWTSPRFTSQSKGDTGVGCPFACETMVLNGSPAHTLIPRSSCSIVGDAREAIPGVGQSGHGPRNGKLDQFLRVKTIAWSALTGSPASAVVLFSESIVYVDIVIFSLPPVLCGHHGHHSGRRNFKSNLQRF
jgi:hypothetical protein